MLLRHGLGWMKSGGGGRLSFQLLLPRAALASTTTSSSSGSSGGGGSPLVENARKLNRHLREVDAEMFAIIEREKRRQLDSIVLIPSENFTSQAVLDCLGSVMQNKYSEGYPGARYYGGNEFIDQSEELCRQRALDTFRLDPAQWGVNVQSLSGSPANLQAYAGLINPHDRIMGLDLPHGGHLSHGYQTDKKKISAVSIYFDTMPYRLNEETGLIDYDMLEKTATLFRPKIIVAGASAYSRNYDFARLRQICDKVGAILLFDMAHISGLVAAGVTPSPFEHADIVTTTTHKSLRGPRGAMIFFRRGPKPGAKTADDVYNYEERINFSVFPGHQGGPHNHTISALAVALKQAKSEEFKLYQQQVIANCRRMAEGFLKKGYKIVSGGTDNHLLLLDLRSKNLDGARCERVLELANIAANKNTVPGDKSALIPGGLRMGSPAMTTRGLNESDFEKIVDYVDRGIQITAAINKQIPGSKLKDFKQHVEDGTKFPEISALKEEVTHFAHSFPAIGFDASSLNNNTK